MSQTKNKSKTPKNTSAKKKEQPDEYLLEIKKIARSLSTLKRIEKRLDELVDNQDELVNYQRTKERRRRQEESLATMTSYL